MLHTHTNYQELWTIVRPTVENCIAKLTNRSYEINQRQVLYKLDQTKEDARFLTIQSPNMLDTAMLIKMLEPIKFIYSYQSVRFDHICQANLYHKLNYCNLLSDKQKNTSDSVIHQALLYQLYAHSEELSHLDQEEIATYIKLMLTKILLCFRHCWVYFEEGVDDNGKKCYKLCSDCFTIDRFKELCAVVFTDFISLERIQLSDRGGYTKMIEKESVHKKYHVSRYTKEQLEEVIARLGRPTIKELNDELGREIADAPLKKYLVKYGLLEKMNYKARVKDSNEFK